jgi:hypothetical protein
MRHGFGSDDGSVIDWSSSPLWSTFTLRGPAVIGFVVRTSDEPMRAVNSVRREITLMDVFSHH